MKWLIEAQLVYFYHYLDSGSRANTSRLFFFSSTKRAITGVPLSMRGPSGGEPCAPWLTLSPQQDEPYSVLDLLIIPDNSSSGGPSWCPFGILSRRSRWNRILKPYPRLPLQEVVREGHYGLGAGGSRGRGGHRKPKPWASDRNILPWNREALGDWKEWEEGAARRVAVAGGRRISTGGKLKTSLRGERFHVEARPLTRLVENCDCVSRKHTLQPSSDRTGSFLVLIWPDRTFLFFLASRFCPRCSARGGCRSSGAPRERPWRPSRSGASRDVGVCQPWLEPASLITLAPTPHVTSDMMQTVMPLRDQDASHPHHYHNSHRPECSHLCL